MTWGSLRPVAFLSGADRGGPADGTRRLALDEPAADLLDFGHRQADERWGVDSKDKEQFPVEKTDEEWRAGLTSEQYRVLRRHGTERAGTSVLNDEHRPGVFRCAGCGQPLYESQAKFESGTGWPSFVQPLAGSVATREDHAHLMTRTEVHCSRCGGHLGHVFPDGPKPTGMRYCMNGAALKFEPKKS
jgi:peptide-methionine (R)-S-oxide reductase